MTTQSSPDTHFHVTLEYAEPGNGGTGLNDVKREEFDVTADEASARIRQVAEEANMDAVHRESMFRHIARMKALYHGFMFLESDPSRRVCLTVNSSNGGSSERSYGFHGPHGGDWRDFR